MVIISFFNIVSINISSRNSFFFNEIFLVKMEDAYMYRRDDKIFF